jgi:ketosteroid isomerase-like protein
MADPQGIGGLMQRALVLGRDVVQHVLRCAVLMALAMLGASAHALDLGTLTLHPQGKGRWQARIVVLDSAGLRPGEIVFRIAPAEVYRVAQRHFEPLLNEARLQVDLPRQRPASVRIDGLQLPAQGGGIDLLLLIGQGGVAGMREYHLSRDAAGQPIAAVDPASRVSALSAAAPRGTALRQANAAQQVTRSMTTTTTTASSAAPATAVALLPAATTAGIAQALSAWTQAWSARDAAGYLAHYTPDFSGTPPLGRARWEAQRRDRLLSRKQIEVSVSELQYQPQGSAVLVTLQQNYRSEKLQQTSRKVLTLVRRGEQWLISNEVEVR